MKAEAIPLSKLYDTLNKGYLIPAYQRPYAWKSEKAEELLDSILADANAAEKFTSLGTVLFSPVSPSPAKHQYGNGTHASIAPSTLWEVVDGQQRLTVLAIVGYALRERWTTLKHGGLAYTPPVEFEQLFSTSRTKTGKQVPVLIREEDHFDNGFKSDIANLLSAFANGLALPGNPDSRLRTTLEVVTKHVANNLHAGNFATFCDYFFSRCQFIQVEADDQDTAFRMFEPLNSTSEPLTAFEVYRSKVVSKLNPVEKFIETSDLLDYENADRDEIVKKSNNLIFAMAQAYSGERPRLHFVELKKYLDKHVDQPFVDKFEIAASFFRTVWFEQISAEPWFDDETQNGIRFLKAARHDLVIPLLVRYFLTNPTDVPAVVKSAVAFFALWRPAFSTSGLPDVYRALLTSGKPGAPKPDNMGLDGGTLKSPKDLNVYLRGEFHKKMGALPAGTTLRDVWMDDTHQLFLNYNELGTLCRLFIFLDMDASLKSNLVTDDPWTSIDDIEHIWPAAISPAPPNVDKVGNLTFLPPKINRSLKAMPWQDRREIYNLLAAPVKTTPSPTKFADGRTLPKAVRDYLADPSGLALMHLQPIASNAKWDKKQIAERNTKMLASVWDVLYNKWLS